MWSSYLSSSSSCFPRWSWSRFFRVQVFWGPAFSGPSFFRVQVFQGPAFSGSSFSGSGSRVRVQVLEVAIQKLVFKNYFNVTFKLDFDSENLSLFKFKILKPPNFDLNTDCNAEYIYRFNFAHCPAYRYRYGPKLPVFLKKADCHLPV